MISATLPIQIPKKRLVRQIQPRIKFELVIIN